MEKVIVTGMGIVSSIGSDLITVNDSLKNLKSGIVFDPYRKEKGFFSGLRGNIKDFEIEKLGLSVKQKKTMNEPCLYAYKAVKDAINLSFLDINSNSTRVGILVGNDSCIKSTYDYLKKYDNSNETKSIGSGAIFSSMNSTISMNLAVLFGIQGINLTVSGACASGSHAIGLGVQMIQLGLMDVMICGGAQENNLETYALFDALGAFSLRETEPHKASKPFDYQRDGLIPSGGAAFIVLESESFAKKRNVSNIFGEIAGYGFSSDGYNLSIPSGEGGKRALIMALKSANISPNEVDYINAHATSTLEGDAKEEMIINSIFGEKVFVSSTKSLTGHECWMSGASEAIYSLLMMQNNFLAGNANFEKQKENAFKINVLKETIEYQPQIIVSNSFGFGGTNAVLVLKRYLS